MKIALSYKNNSDIISLPYVEEDSVSIDYGTANSETFDSIYQGNIRALGSKPLASVSFSGKISDRKYSFADNIAVDEFKEWILDKKDHNRIVRLVMTRSGKEESFFNRLVSIESFSLTGPARNGEWQYSLELGEYKKATIPKFKR